MTVKKQNRIHFLQNQTPEQMMSFIIETQDEKLIVIDGGTRGDTTFLLQQLREISGQQKPRVDAWFLTHCHADHITAFMELQKMQPAALTIDKVYYNFTSRQFMRKYDVDAGATLDAFYNLLPCFATASEIVSWGDEYDIGAAHFSVLYTHNPAFTNNACNNSSIVLRMTLAGQSVLFLADLGVEAGAWLLEKYGSALKSDFCQLAHHGQNGVERDVYAAIAPKGCFWCTPQWLWDNDAGEGYNTAGWKTIEVQGWMKQLGVLKNFAIKDGYFDLAFPYAF